MLIYCALTDTDLPACLSEMLALKILKLKYAYPNEHFNRRRYSTRSIQQKASSFYAHFAYTT